MSSHVTEKTAATLSLHDRQRRALLAGALACAAAMAALLPVESLPSFSCTFHDLTGHSCFTCGMTRSLSAFAHGEFSASFGYHLMGAPLFLGLLTAIVCLAGEAVTGRRWYPAAKAGFVRKTLIL